MGIRTKADITAEYLEYKAAQSTILGSGQEYTIKDRSLKRADLAFIAAQIKTLANEMLKAEVDGKIRLKQVNIDYSQ